MRSVAFIEILRQVLYGLIAVWHRWLRRNPFIVRGNAKQVCYGTSVRRNGRCTMRCSREQKKFYVIISLHKTHLLRIAAIANIPLHQGYNPQDD
jgi:hypothetical protein